MVKYSLDGIHCRDCGHDLERNLEGKEGIIDASESFGAGFRFRMATYATHTTSTTIRIMVVFGFILVLLPS